MSIAFGKKVRRVYLVVCIRLLEGVVFGILMVLVVYDYWLREQQDMVELFSIEIILWYV